MICDVFCVDVDLEKVDNVEFFQKEGQCAGRHCRLSFLQKMAETNASDRVELCGGLS